MKTFPFGLASCLVFGCVLFCLWGVVAIILLMKVDHPSLVYAICGVLVAWVAWGLSLIGFFLGCAGLFQRERKRGSAVCGAVLNGLVLLPGTGWWVLWLWPFF